MLDNSSSNDYDSKVSKLLHNFSDDMDVERVVEPVKDKIVFVQNKNNEDVLINLKNDERRYIEIPKNKIDLELGRNILEYIDQLNELKINPKNKISDYSDKRDKEKTESKKIALVSNQSKFKKKPQFSTSGNSSTVIFSTKQASLTQSSESEFYSLVNNDKNKIPKLKMSYREYFYTSPKCDLCDQTGITSEEFKKSTNKEFQMDCVVLDYFLFQCLVCKVYLHKNCAYEITNFPFIDVKDTLPINSNWICDRCKVLPQLDDNSQCQICLKKDSQFKKPHFYKMLDKSFWVHSQCLFWFKYTFNISEENSIQIKLKQYLLMNNINTQCYKCTGNDKRIFTMKCSMTNCSKYYHPICVKEGLFYSNLTLVDDLLLAVAFCEEHSQKFLIEELNFKSQ